MKNEQMVNRQRKKYFIFSTYKRKSVCIQVDKQCEPREPYEQSLQSVCESLEHKFYYDRLFKQMEKQIRAEAIDDFVQKVKEHQYVLSDVINSKDYGMFTVGIEQIAEQLKAGGMNEYNI